MAPHQIISLRTCRGPQSFALADHYDHVHVGYYPLYGNGAPRQAVRRAAEAGAVAAPDRPPRRDRQPDRSRSPRPKYSLPAKKKGKGKGDGGTEAKGGRASDAHVGE